MKDNIRKEKEIFDDLGEICTRPGFVHIIAYFCYRDNIIKYRDEITPDDMSSQASRNRLIRTEISTLIGLMLKQEIDFSLPQPDDFQKMADQTEELLKELHKSMSQAFFTDFKPDEISGEKFNPFNKGAALREPIFYGGESAYIFQYQDIAIKRYIQDDKWFQENKGYSVCDAHEVIKCIRKIQTEKIQATLEELKNRNSDEWTILAGFEFGVDDIQIYIDRNCADINRVKIKNILNSFAFPYEGRNEYFVSLGDFNMANACPLIRLNGDRYLLFQYYSLCEAFYENPFYWFNEDKYYLEEAKKNRGRFTEEFSAERLKLVFGEKNVFLNVDIVHTKGNKDKAGEIDVLVIFADRAIILQAKSKKLTIEARKGNDNCLKDDFKKAVQNSYDQGLTCAKLIGNKSCKLCDQNSNEININRDYKEIYIFCVVSDHYPALTFQARQFLKYEQTGQILPPFVMDVFFLDVMTEMLQSPLQFLSYVNRRLLYNPTCDLLKYSFLLCKIFLRNKRPEEENYGSRNYI